MRTEDKVREIILSLSAQEAVEANDFLQSDVGLDSLAMIALLLEIEEGFSIELDESDMDPFKLVTVSSVIDLAKKYVGEEYEQKS